MGFVLKKAIVRYGGPDYEMPRHGLPVAIEKEADLNCETLKSAIRRATNFTPTDLRIEMSGGFPELGFPPRIVALAFGAGVIIEWHKE